MRGEVVQGLSDAAPDRITPACAGRSTASAASRFAYKDHPRVCGEKSVFIKVKLFDIGSPPRVRGEGCPVATGELCPGITPACAGRSKADYIIRVHGKDHPRVCGEKCSALTCRRIV